MSKLINGLVIPFVIGTQAVAPLTYLSSWEIASELKKLEQIAQTQAMASEKKSQATVNYQGDNVFIQVPNQATTHSGPTTPARVKKRPSHKMTFAEIERNILLLEEEVKQRNKGKKGTELGRFCKKISGKIAYGQKEQSIR